MHFKVQKSVKRKYSEVKFQFFGDKSTKNKRLSTNFCTNTEEVTLFEQMDQKAFQNNNKVIVNQDRVK
jgi:hypothetical protein